MKLNIVFRSGVTINVTCENYSVAYSRQDKKLVELKIVNPRNKEIVFIDVNEVACVFAEK